MKVHIIFVIGKRDIKADAARFRVHDKGNSAPNSAPKPSRKVWSRSKGAAPVEFLDEGPQASYFWQSGRDWRARLVPVCALLVRMCDLQNARFIERFA